MSKFVDALKIPKKGGKESPFGRCVLEEAASFGKFVDSDGGAAKRMRKGVSMLEEHGD